MFEFQWLFSFFLLPLPFLVWRFVTPLKKQVSSMLNVPFINDFQQPSLGLKSPNANYLLLFSVLAWISLITALARPVWLGEPIQLTSSGRNIMIAVDLSASMREQDFILRGLRVNRLVATKSIAGEFIKRREGDRIGLILFGDLAYLQAPLTFDRYTVNQLLQESQLGLAGKKTALGDAIGLAVKHTSKDKEGEHVLILMTDGAASAGMNVEEASQLAVESGLKIYTVGIGANNNTFDSFFNNAASLDEKTLKKIAKITGGRYFAATNTQEFGNIYKLLDKLEPVQKEKELWHPKVDLFYWPLAIFLGLFSLVLLLRYINKERGL